MPYSEKIDKTVFICFVIWLVAMGGGLADFNSHSLNLNSITQCVLPLTLVYYAVRMKFRPTRLKPLGIVLGVLLIWQLLLIYKFGSYHVLIGRSYDVLFAFIIIRTLGLKRFFFYFETAVAKLCILSVCLWGLMVLFPPIKNMLAPLSFPINESGTQIAHWGIVGISNSENLGLIRNLGFAWEPGRFSSIVVIALLMHLFGTRFVLFQKNFWPLFLGVLTSLATTGYMAMGVCVIGYFFNARKSASSQFLKFLLPTLFILMAISSPFLLDKIKQVSDADTFLTDGGAQYYIENERKYVPQRTEGLYLDFLNIIDSPWIGYGDETDYSYVRRIAFPNLHIILSNGVLQIIAMMGIPLALLFYWALYRSSKLFALFFQIKGTTLFFLVICAVNVSYNFFYDPLFICMVLYCLFMPESDKKELANVSSKV